MKFITAVAACLALVLLALTGCDRPPALSASGVYRAEVSVKPDPQTGLTVEQNAVSKRLTEDNEPGALKHLYVLSPWDGRVLMYSTVAGKVTSSGKRLTGKTIPEVVFSGDSKQHQGFRIIIGGEITTTAEVLQDDGTYGDSVWYLYWFDQNDVYHQHFPNDDQVIAITDTPLAPVHIRGALNLDPKR